MSWQTYTDGISAWTAEDIAAMQDQSSAVFGSTTERDGAVTDPKIGQLTCITARSSLERWNGSSWDIIYAQRQRYAVGATPPTTTDASHAVLLTSVGTLVSGATYRVTGLVRVTGGTCRLTSLGSLTGVWGNAVDGSDGALFDQTSADATITLAQGLNPIVGEITATANTTWDVSSYYNSGSAVIEAISYLQSERIA